MRFLMLAVLFSLSGCYSIHDRPPESITEGCSVVNDEERIVYFEESFNILNAAVPTGNNFQFCFIHGMDAAPESMVQGCAEYISHATSCDDARLRREFCEGCRETWDSNL